MNAAAKSMVKRVVFSVLGSDILLGRRLRQLAQCDALTILNLHRVDDHEGSAYGAMKPALFEDLVCWLKGNFRIVTFADLVALPPDGKPPLILSFDDGYKDFVEIVVPILARYRIRANQNVIPASIESGLPPMNVVLQDFIGMAPVALLQEMTVPGFAGGFDIKDRVRYGNRASAAFKCKPIAEQKTIFAKLEQSFLRFDAFRTTPMMTLDEVRQIAVEHEIGAHSFEHASMAAETDEYLQDDLGRCRMYFNQRLGLRSKIYTFPNGSCRPGQANRVLSSGFEHVLLVGNNRSTVTAQCHHRFGLHTQTLPEAKFRALGSFRRLGIEISKSGNLDMTT